jgi:hypothetical protein
MAGSALGRPEGARAIKAVPFPTSRLWTGSHSGESKWRGDGIRDDLVDIALEKRSGGRQGRAASLLHQSQPHLAGIITMKR